MTRRLFVSLTVFLLLFSGRVVPVEAARRSTSLTAFEQRYETLSSDFESELESLATWCEQQGLEAEAKQTRALLDRKVEDSVMVFRVLPRAAGYEPEVGESPQSEAWGRRFKRLRVEQAGELFSLATRAFKAEQLSFSYDLVRLAAELNPDHRKARSLLGYSRYRGNWVTAHESAMMRSGHVHHDAFGWLKRGWVRRYENEERNFRGRWVAAEEEAVLRRDWENAWELRTDHYVIRTNYSFERARELGQKLEHLYDVFFRTFIGFFTPRQHMNVLFEGRSTGHAMRREHPFRVRYYRTKNEYVEALRSRVGDNIEISLGLYVPSEQAACFFHDEQFDDDMTLWHEATHQLFYESRLPPRGSRQPRHLPGEHANFWVIEGIACYMETFREEGDRFRIGGFDNDRFRAARHRALKDGFYLPLERLTAMGMDDLQSSPDIRPLYSQAAGLATFLMHYDHGRYRDALVEYLQRVYAGTDTPTTLREVTGATYQELDEQYLDYLRSGSEEERAEALLSR